MTASVISLKKSYRQECQRRYESRLHLGIPMKDARAFVYSWHEEGESHQCKIGYCSKEPFSYLWDGTALSHQKRLPVIFLTIGATSKEAAKWCEGRLHHVFEEFHMKRSCAREWFDVEKTSVCEAAREVVSQMESERAL